MCAESSLVWTGVIVGDATVAPYSADEYSDYIREIVQYDRTVMGVIPTADAAYNGNLAVTNPAGVTIRVATGIAMVDGTLYTNNANVDNVVVAPGAGSNFYRVVLRKSWAAQTVRVALLGPNAVVPPAVTQTDGVTWEISLATVQITAASVITITETRVLTGAVQASLSDIDIGTGSLVMGGEAHTGTLSENSVILGGTTHVFSTSGFDGNSAILAGFNNSVEDGSNTSAIIAGTTNVIEAAYDSAIIGGTNNLLQQTVTGPSCCAIIAGNDNTILETASESVIVGGDGNTIGISAADSVIVGGSANTLATAADRVVVLGGQRNDVAQAGDNSVVMGQNANSSHLSGFVQGGGYFAATAERGTTQLGKYILGRTVTHGDAGWYQLWLSPTGLSGNLVLQTDSVWRFVAQIVGTTQGCTKSFGFQIDGVIENDGGTTTMLATTRYTIYDTDDVSFDARASADDPNNALLIELQDSDGSGDVVRWVATVETTEIIFPA